MNTKQMPRANAVATEAVIAEYLKALKLPAFATEYPGLVRRATEGGWDYEDFLRELLEVEVRSREERTAKRRLKEARFPDVKTFEQLDWETLKGVSRQKIMELATCEFLEASADVIIAGPVGTGKTHLAISWRRSSQTPLPGSVLPRDRPGAHPHRSPRREDTDAVAPPAAQGRPAHPRRAGVCSLRAGRRRAIVRPHLPEA